LIFLQTAVSSGQRISTLTAQSRIEGISTEDSSRSRRALIIDFSTLEAIPEPHDVLWRE
jgi:hypothetical protein